MNSNLFNVLLYLNDDNNKPRKLEETVEFDQIANSYGNGYHMTVYGESEPFGRQSYDIRYDREFNSHIKIPYIVQFFANRYTGEEGSWKLTGIEVRETEPEDE